MHHFENILEATGRLLDRVGYEATTTTAIAKEAKTSMGTVYEYFRDRDAPLRVLLERYRCRLKETVEASLAGADRSSWRSLTHRTVQVFVEFYRREPGYRVLWLDSLTTPTRRDAGVAWGNEFGEMLAGLLPNVVPRISRLGLRAVARTIVHLVSALTSMALVGPRELEETSLREVRRAVESYIEAVIREPP